MNELRYTLFDEAEVILGIVSFLLGVITFVNVNETLKKRLAIYSTILTVLIAANYVDLKYFHPVEMHEVPAITGMRYTSAQEVLRSHGFVEKPVGYASEELIFEENPIVYAQSPLAGNTISKGSEVFLTFQENTISAANKNNSTLSIQIDSYKLFVNGFHYEYPDPQNPERTLLLDFNTGISGTYKYSRDLTENEYTNWFHGGKLYDEFGNEVGSEGNYPTFWSNPNGMFVCEFPSDLKPGTYKYELYQYIAGQPVSDLISIVVE